MIDVHAHVVLDGVLGCAGAYGPDLDTGPDGRPRFRVGNYELHGVRYRESAFMDVDRRLTAIDRLGIDIQILSPNPLTYFHHIEAPIATGFCQWHNESLARVVGQRPDRFRGFAQLPMQDVDAAVIELRRAVGDLGLVGAYIGTDFGLTFDDERLDPLYAAFVELDVPMFIHPAPAGIDGPLHDLRIRRFDLDLSLGFLYEETLAVACIVYGEVLNRHSGLDICVSHGGGAATLMEGRLAHAGRSRPWAQPDGVDFGAGLRKLWFDNHVHDDAGLAFVEAKVGVERLVIGTNLAGWDTPTTPAELHHRPEYDGAARRLLRLNRDRPAEPVLTVTRHLACVARRDPAAMAADYADDAVLSRGADEYRGRDAIERYFSAVPGRLAGRDLRFEPPVVDGSAIVVRWVIGDDAAGSGATGTDRYIIDGNRIVGQTVELDGDDF